MFGRRYFGGRFFAQNFFGQATEYIPIAAALAVASSAPAVALGPFSATPDAPAITAASSAPAIALGPFSTTPPIAEATLAPATPRTVEMFDVETIDTVSYVAVGAGIEVKPEPASAELAATSSRPVLNFIYPVPAASLTVTSSAPTVASTDDRVVQPQWADLVVTGFEPLIVGLGEVVVRPAASKTYYGGRFFGDHYSGIGYFGGGATTALTITSSAPTIVASTVVEPAATSITAVTSVPTVALGPFAAAPDAADITASSSAPTITSSQDVAVQSGWASLDVTSSAPLVFTPVAVTVSPAVAALIMSGNVPTLTGILTPTLTPDFTIVLAPNGRIVTLTHITREVIVG